MRNDDTGIYIAVFHLDVRRSIRVGRLGRFCFEPGFYFYVGSARRYLDARLSRHARRRKPLRWHIDYLSTRAEMLGAITIHDERRSECDLAHELARLVPRHIPNFGASDCRCPGHLFHTAELGIAPR